MHVALAQGRVVRGEPRAERLVQGVEQPPPEPRLRREPGNRRALIMCSDVNVSNRTIMYPVTYRQARNLLLC